jgi:hypothetical protein
MSRAAEFPLAYQTPLLPALVMKIVPSDTTIAELEKKATL